MEDSSTDRASPNPNHESYRVPGLERGLIILEALADAKRPMSMSDLAAQIGLPRSSVFRLIYTLKHMGFVDEAEGTKLLTLGARVLNIGFAFLSSKDIIEVSRRDLEMLRDATGVSAHLAIRDKGEVLYLNSVQTRSGFLSNMNVGSRLPVYASPMGWCLVSRLNDGELRELFAGAKFIPMTNATPQSVDRLKERIASIVREGYVVSRGAMEAGGSSIAAPIFDRFGGVVAAIDLSGPDVAFGDLARRERVFTRELLEASRRISAKTGFVPS